MNEYVQFSAKTKNEAITKGHPMSRRRQCREAEKWKSTAQIFFLYFVYA